MCVLHLCLQLVGAASSSARTHTVGRAVAVLTLLDTATLWQYGGPASNTSAPLLAAQAVQLDAPAPPVTGLPLRQPLGAQPLQLGTRPRGFWNGAVSFLMLLLAHTEHNGGDNAGVGSRAARRSLSC